jgi:hypothetical protein
VTLYSWITSGRLPVAGYLSKGGVVARKGHRSEPKVFSLAAARALRRKEASAAL